MKKKISLGMTMFLMVIVCILTMALTLIFVPNAISAYFGNNVAYSKLLSIDSLIKSKFLGDVDEQTLADAMAKGYMSGLEDKYSAYFSVEENKSIKLSNEGNGAGIGITVVKHPDNGYIYVLLVSPESPAGLAGVKSGDQIVSVAGEPVVTVGYDASVEKLHGDVGADVSFTVLRGEDSIDFNVTRSEYTVCSVYSHMIGNIGYVKITTFNSATVNQFSNAIADLQNQGATALIFDVRDNFGGTVDSVEKMLDLLLPEGTVISAEYSEGKKKVLYTSDANQIDLPMTVLMNKNTASAAELFAAAIRDFNKGELIGTVSYGKGVMQSTYDLADGSAVRITVAKFNPPSGVNFNGVGLFPDIEVNYTEEQQSRAFLLSDEEDPFIAAAISALKQ